MSGNTVFGKDFLKTPSFMKFCLHTSPPSPPPPLEKNSLENTKAREGSSRSGLWFSVFTMATLLRSVFLEDKFISVGTHSSKLRDFPSNDRTWIPSAHQLAVCLHHIKKTSRTITNLQSSSFEYVWLFSELLWNPSKDEFFTLAVYQISL